MNSLKERLYKMCIDYVQVRIDGAKQGIADAQYAAIEETKSSAGDKYETGREMMQQETDRSQLLLNEANKLMVALSRINPNSQHTVAEPGSLILTNNGTFFLAISAGSFLLDGTTYFAVSPASPIGTYLIGRRAGDQFSLNGRTYVVEAVN